jgi:MoaA/NifB/PqqE/SkfB family radical SAM enzyme
MPVTTQIVDLELTNACPADCPMCPRDALPSLGVMTESLFDRVCAEIGKSSTLRWVSLCGIGEPLLHPRIVDWVARLVGLPSRPKVGLVSAGQKLTAEKFLALQAAGLSKVAISVQAVDQELYSRLMPGLVLERVLANLDAIAALETRRVPLTIQITQHAANEAHVPAIVDYAHKRGFRTQVNAIHSRGGHVADASLQRIPPAVSPIRPCRIFDKITFIAWDGRVHYCCHDVSRQNVVGLLATESLHTINARKQELVEPAGGPSANICERCDDSLRDTL